MTKKSTLNFKKIRAESIKFILSQINRKTSVNKQVFRTVNSVMGYMKD